MSNNEKIARFCGWTTVNGSIWESPAQLRMLIGCDAFTKDHNLFIEAWNKGVEAFTPELKRRIKERGIPSMITVDEDRIFRALNLLPYEFILKRRLPILINIIDFLEKV